MIHGKGSGSPLLGRWQPRSLQNCPGVVVVAIESTKVARGAGWGQAPPVIFVEELVTAHGQNHDHAIDLVDDVQIVANCLSNHNLDGFIDNAKYSFESGQRLGVADDPSSRD